MSISMQQVKELRDRTQAGLNDCKSALSEANGDMEKAVELILKKGLAKSAKRAGAIATEGVVAARVAADQRSGILVEVNIQTDFAARNTDFLAFVEKVVEAASKATDGQNLGDVEVGGETIEAQRAALVGKLGENVTVRRWSRVSVAQGFVHSYIHMGGKIGALVGLTSSDAVAKSADAKQFADDVAMQVAAMAPLYSRPEDVPEADRAKQSEIFEAQLEEEGKPAAARPKIIEGKLAKWMKEVCLLEQVSIMDSEKTVAQKLAELSKVVGTGIELSGFARYQCGEGIEKKQDDFAAEAQRMAQG